MSKMNFAIEESLILKYAFKQPLTAEESAQLETWRETMKYHRDLPDQFADFHWVARQLDEMDHYPVDRIWEKIVARIKEKPAPRAFPRWPIRAAAALLLVIAGVFLLVRYVFRKPGISSNPAQVAVVSVEQGSTGSGTLLTLSGNRKIALDGAGRDSLLSTEYHIAIRKVDSNQLSYLAVGGLLPEKDTGYNTLSTKKVTPYILALSDGTSISLNTASTIRYPVAFAGKDREVELISGEAEFNVRRNPSSPFRVIVNGIVVKVLGTNFIITAYPGEPERRITVLHGQVRVVANKDSLLLQPLEQAWVDTAGLLHRRTISDTTSLLAWKKDRQFHLDGKSLDGVLREVARWYDLKLPDLSNIRGRPIGGGGMLSRDLSAAIVLDKIQELQHGKIKFSLNGDSLRIKTNP